MDISLLSNYYVFLRKTKLNRHSKLSNTFFIYLRDLPPPLGRSEDVQVSLPEVSSQQQDQPAVAHEQGVVVTVHFYTKIGDAKVVR